MMDFFPDHTSWRYLFFSLRRSTDGRVSFRLVNFSYIWNFLFVSNTALFRRFRPSPLCTIIKLFSHPLFLGTLACRSTFQPACNFRTYVRGAFALLHQRWQYRRTPDPSEVSYSCLFPPPSGHAFVSSPKTSVHSFFGQLYRRFPFTPLILPIFLIVYISIVSCFLGYARHF